MEIIGQTVYYYVALSGRTPYLEWYHSIRDKKTQGIIDERITRLWLGNFNQCKPVGKSVFELKISYGPGFRIYFGRIGIAIVLLLTGGDKSTQEEDIQKAHKYWEDYRRRRDEATRKLP